MSNVSIFEKNWTDLVFEGKNKAYGAYQLRQENPRTSLIAFISGIALILTLLGCWMLLSSFGDRTDPSVTDGGEVVIKISDFNYPKKEPEKQEAIVPLKKQELQKKIDKKDLQNIVLVKDNPDEVRTNKEMKENPMTNSSTDATGTTGSTATAGTSSTTTTGTAAPTSKGPEGTVNANELDRLPEYPGKMQKFYEYIAKNIRPEDDSATSMNVIMAFVIEKDGSMSDIRVLRSSDKYLEQEAIRVLKSIKVKWAPGFKDGQKVRTQYTLPIRIAL